MEIVYDIRDEVETLAAKLPARSAWRIRPAFPDEGSTFKRRTVLLKTARVLGQYSAFTLFSALGVKLSTGDKPMPKVTANNYEMHYELDDFTDPWKTPETVWIQHGFGRSSRFWYHWVPPLASRYRVLRRDMRGHGQSADPGRNYVWSVDDLLSDMKGFLDALGLDRVHYVGESVGGILGVAFATRWPERFKSMTLCATPTAIRPPIQQMFAVGHENWETALGKLGPGGWVKALMEQGGGIGGANPSHVDWIVSEWSKTPTHVLQGLCRMVPSVDITPLLPQVRVPTLVLAPARSPISPLSEQVMIRDSIPGARIAVVEGRGHEIYVDDPAACIAALVGFLATL